MKSDRPSIFTSRFSKLFCVMLALSIISVPTLLAALPQKSYSPEENRMLATFPTFSAEGVLSGEYTAGVSLYLRDHLPMRTTLLKTKAAAEYAALKRENNHIIIAKDGYLVKRFDYTEQQKNALASNCETIEMLTDVLKTYQKPVVFLRAPRAIDVLYGLCPAQMPAPTDVPPPTDPISQAVTEVLIQKSRSGEYVWFRTDHHWTPLGAYYAYSQLGDALSYTPFPKTAFSETDVCDGFFGTSYSAGLPPLCQGDRITVFQYEGDDDFLCTDMMTGTQQAGFYRPEALSNPSRYEYFLGKNTAHLRIQKTDGASTRPTLLIIKDSYAQCLVPFLARHFNIEMLDLRYFRTDATETISQILASPDYGGALFLFNSDTLTGDAGLSRISAEKLQ